MSISHHHLDASETHAMLLKCWQGEWLGRITRKKLSESRHNGHMTKVSHNVGPIIVTVCHRIVSGFVGEASIAF